jgi:hypothetical protein
MQATMRRDRSGDISRSARSDASDPDLNDLLQELRILLQGAQVLTAFLTIVPFSEGFGRLDQFERLVFLITFVSSLAGLIFISAPAAQHRLERPLKDRERFKQYATRMTLVGLGAISVALVLATQLVSNEVVGFTPSIVTSIVVAVLIGVFWWLVPVLSRRSA